MTEKFQAPEGAHRATPAGFTPEDWTRRVLRHALEAIEAGASASIVMNVEGLKDNIRALLAAPSPAEGDEPLFWYRPCSDGLYEGPLHHKQIEDVRKRSGAWVPLYPARQPNVQPKGSDERATFYVPPGRQYKAPAPAPKMADAQAEKLLKDFAIAVMFGSLEDRAAKAAPIKAALSAVQAPAVDDAKRLDWLQAAEQTVWRSLHAQRRPKTDGSGEFERALVFEGWCVFDQDTPLPTIREAIDAAMAVSHVPVQPMGDA